MEDRRRLPPQSGPVGGLVSGNRHAGLKAARPAIEYAGGGRGTRGLGARPASAKDSPSPPWRSLPFFPQPAVSAETPAGLVLFRRALRRSWLRERVCTCCPIRPCFFFFFPHLLSPSHFPPSAAAPLTLVEKATVSIARPASLPPAAHGGQSRHPAHAHIDRHSVFFRRPNFVGHLSSEHMTLFY